MGKARARKRHIQTNLVFKLTKNGKPMPCGKKGRSGRRSKGKYAGAPHTKRPELKARHPLHVVLRVNKEVGSLRKRFMYAALRMATITVAMRELYDAEDGAFRLIHVSIQRNHIHLIVEADSKQALSRGMRSFQISAAKHINRAASRNLEKRRRGPVFADRYHAEVITTPKQARHTLAYVLNNWRKHQEDRGDARAWNVDPYSTGWHFMGWKERAGEVFHWKHRDTWDPLVVYLPQTWLLTDGWRKHGLISFDEVPSAKMMAAMSRQLPTRSAAAA